MAFNNNQIKTNPFFDHENLFIWWLREHIDIWKTSLNLICILDNNFMSDPILYLSMFLGLWGVYVLISSFDDDDDDDGERFLINSDLLTELGN